MPKNRILTMLPIPQVFLASLCLFSCLGSLYGEQGEGSDSLPAPQTLVFDGAAMAETYKHVSANNPLVKPALAQLRKSADAALSKGPWTVTTKNAMPPSGDKHDYMSQAPYWWPDPEKPDGLPFIWRDGERNPDRDGHDSGSLKKTAENSLTLAMAWYYTRDERYAAHAAKLLQTWFIDPKTKMNAHLNFAQGIPGRNQGRGTGIIETRGLVHLVDAALILELSKVWTQDDSAALRQWFRSYLEWLLTSKHGKDEHRKKTNHGTWYDAQVASFALFTNQPQLARDTIHTSGRQRIATQISREGKQAHELRRTKSWNYSSLNLKGLFALAALGRHVDINLWNYRSEKGGSIRDALDWLTPFATGDREWTHTQISPMEVIRIAEILRQATLAYGDPSYQKILREIIPFEKLSKNSLQLKFPLPLKD